MFSQLRSLFSGRRSSSGRNRLRNGDLFRLRLQLEHPGEIGSVGAFLDLQVWIWPRFLTRANCRSSAGSREIPACRAKPSPLAPTVPTVRTLSLQTSAQTLVSRVGTRSRSRRQPIVAQRSPLSSLGLHLGFWSCCLQGCRSSSCRRSCHVSPEEKLLAAEVRRVLTRLPRARIF